MRRAITFTGNAYFPDLLLWIVLLFWTFLWFSAQIIVLSDVIGEFKSYEWYISISGVLELEKLRVYFTLKIPSQGLWYSPSPIFFQSARNSFLFNWIRKIRKSRIFRLSEDHQFWVNLWNLGKCRHAPYTYEQSLVIQIYLRCELSIISILYFVHIVQDDSPQVLIEPIGFTVESISKDVISRHCCGLGFCVKCLAKWAAKDSELLSLIIFWATY